MTTNDPMAAELLGRLERCARLAQIAEADEMPHLARLAHEATLAVFGECAQNGLLVEADEVLDACLEQLRDSGD